MRCYLIMSDLADLEASLQQFAQNIGHEPDHIACNQHTWFTMYRNVLETHAQARQPLIGPMATMIVKQPKPTLIEFMGIPVIADEDVLDGMFAIRSSRNESDRR